jgi:hypothetical protein
MPRRIAYSLAFAIAAAGLVWSGWRGGPANPATLINKTGVIATVVILAGLPWAIRRVFGPAAASRLARIARVSGYAALFALVAVKSDVARFEYALAAQRHVLAGIWAGEVVFLMVLAAYAAGLLAATARRPPAAPAALAVGIRAGVAVALVMYVLPPMGHPLHVANPWLTWAYNAARVLALLLVLGIAIAAGIAAARRTPVRGSRLPPADARARHGVTAGLCAGAVAALLVSVLGVSTIALLPQEANRLTWTLPYRYTVPRSPASLWQYRHAPPMQYQYSAPDAVYEFEVGASDSAAGYLVVLVFFPVLGAGLGAWGGLYGAGQPRRRPGGGGGGSGGPAPLPPPPDDDVCRDDERLPAILRGGYLRELPVTEGLPAAPENEPATPVGTSAHARIARGWPLNYGDGREPGPAGG